MHRVFWSERTYWVHQWLVLLICKHADKKESMFDDGQPHCGRHDDAPLTAGPCRTVIITQHHPRALLSHRPATQQTLKQQTLAGPSKSAKPTTDELPAYTAVRCLKEGVGKAP